MLPGLVACSGGGKESTSSTPDTPELTGDTAPTCQAEIVPGQGVIDFVALADGEVATIIHGPQGGYHVDAAVRLCGLSPAPTSIHTVITWLAEEQVVADITVTKPEIPEDDCCRVATDMTAFLNVGIYDSPADLLHGELARMVVEVTDGDGVVHTGSVDVELRNP